MPVLGNMGYRCCPEATRNPAAQSSQRIISHCLSGNYLYDIWGQRNARRRLSATTGPSADSPSQYDIESALTPASDMRKEYPRLEANVIEARASSERSGGAGHMHRYYARW